MVFFTERFVPEREAWLQERAAAGWLGGAATWLASLRTPDNPFADSAWRQEQGGLWDVGPHALSRRCCRCSARSPRSPAPADARTWCTWCCPTRAARPARSALSLTMPPDATRAGLEFYDEHGWHVRPDTGQAASGDVVSPPAARGRRAGGDASARDARDHRCDVRFGAEVVRVLEEAERVLDGGQGHQAP